MRPPRDVRHRATLRRVHAASRATLASLVLAAHARNAQDDSRGERDELRRQESLFVAQQDRLVNLAITGAIDENALAAKNTQLRDWLSAIKVKLDVVDRSHDETADLTIKAFELSQTLRARWLTADYAAKLRILGILCLNCTLDGRTFRAELRRPFHALADGLLATIEPSASTEDGGGKPVESRNGRGDRI